MLQNNILLLLLLLYIQNPENIDFSYILTVLKLKYLNPNNIILVHTLIDIDNFIKIFFTYKIDLFIAIIYRSKSLKMYKQQPYVCLE